MGQLLLSSAIIRSRTPGNVVGSRLGLYFPLLADKTNTNDKLCSRGTEKKNPQRSEPLTPSVLDYRIPGTDASLVGRHFQGKKA